jgi:hypothetical protein
MKTTRIAVLITVALCAMPLFAAAVDMFLKIDGVQGTAQDSAHKGWFELTSWSWTLPNPAAVPKTICSVHEAKFAAAINTPAELRLKQICDAHARLPQLMVDIKGQRHTLQNVAFRTCEGQALGASMSKVFTIYFDRCATHSRLTPAAAVNP